MMFALRILVDILQHAEDTSYVGITYVVNYIIWFSHIKLSKNF